MAKKKIVKKAAKPVAKKKPVNAGAPPREQQIDTITSGNGMLFGLDRSTGDVYVWDAYSRSWKPNWMTPAQKREHDAMRKIAPGVAEETNKATEQAGATDPLA